MTPILSFDIRFWSVLFVFVSCPLVLPLSLFLSKFSSFLWCQMETCHFCKATICSSSSCYSSASLNPFSIYNLRHINKYLFLFICCTVNLFIVYSSWISDLYPRLLYVLFCNLHLLFWACHRYFGNLCKLLDGVMVIPLM